MDWVCSMTLGWPGGPMRASAPYKGGSYGEVEEPLRPCCARPAPHFVRSLFCAGKARVKVSSLCGEVVERQR